MVLLTWINLIPAWISNYIQYVALFKFGSSYTPNTECSVVTDTGRYNNVIVTLKRRRNIVFT